MIPRKSYLLAFPLISMAVPQLVQNLLAYVIRNHQSAEVKICDLIFNLGKWQLNQLKTINITEISVKKWKICNNFVDKHDIYMNCKFLF